MPTPTPHCESSLASSVYYRTLEHAKVVAEMGWNGLRVRVASIAPLLAWADSEIATTKAALAQEPLFTYFLKREGLAEFNINSPPQKQALVFGTLGLRAAKFSKKTQAPSCDAAFLEQHADDHPIIPLLLRWAEVAKLKSSFIETLPDLMVPEPDGEHGVLHPDWRMGGAGTWRLSPAFGSRPGRHSPR